MLPYIYLLFLIGITTINTILSKKFQLGFQQNLTRFCCYLMLNSLFASIFLSVANGFKVNINLSTFLFSVVYAIIVSFSLTLNLIALSRVQIPLVTITSTSGSIITSSLFGILFLDDKLTLKLLLAIILILSAVLIPYLKLHINNSKNSILICVLIFLNSGASVIITKLFTLNKSVTDSKSFFVLTNIILFILSGLLLMILWFKSKENRKIIKHPFNKKQVLSVAILTGLSNLSSIISILAIAKIPITTYTIANSSFSLISSTLLSKFYFKERVNKTIIVSVIFAIGAIVVNVLE